MKVIFVAFLDIQMNRKRAHASNLTSEANNIKFQLPSPPVNANKHVYEMSWVLSSLLYKSSKAGMQHLQITRLKQEVEKDRGGQCLQINQAYELIKNQSLQEYKQSELGI